MDTPETNANITTAMQQLPDWTITDHDGIKHLERVFPFGNFIQALTFANRVGDLAEEAEHHPSIVVEWGKTSVSWWTHSTGGLSENDFALAKRTDEIYKATLEE